MGGRLVIALSAAVLPTPLTLVGLITLSLTALTAFEARRFPGTGRRLFPSRSGFETRSADALTRHGRPPED